MNALLQLGESYWRVGEAELARKYYKASLHIKNTDATYVQRRLGEMERMIDSPAACRIEQEVRKNGITSARNAFRRIKSDPSDRLYFAEHEFNAVGYTLTGKWPAENDRHFEWTSLTPHTLLRRSRTCEQME